MLTPVAGVLAVLNALSPGSFRNPADPFDRVAYSNRSTKQEVEDKGASAEINWDLEALGGATVTSISAWRDWETINGQDGDFTTVDILYRRPDGNFGNSFKQLTQEFRLAGESEKLSWLVGLFYADEDLDSRDQLIQGTQFQQYFIGLTGGPASPWSACRPLLIQPMAATRDVYQQESKNWALFTNNSIRFTDALELTLGLRYTDESKDLDSQYSNEHTGQGCSLLRANTAFRAAASGLAGAAAQAQALTVYGIGCSVTYADPIFGNVATSQSLDEEEWSGTAKIAYRFNDDVMSYLSYAKGYKAGGFNLYRERNGIFFLPIGAPGGPTVDTDTHFEKETVDSYELGVKTQWADNSLLVNGALFYQDYSDFQLNTFTGLQFIVTSLPQVVSQGVDLDFVWYTPLEQLSFQGGVTYAETTIEDFGGPANLAFFRPEREDDTLSFAPEYSASLSATYEQPIGNNLLIRGNIGARYTSEYNTGSNLDPRKIQDAMTLVNARVGFGADDEKWMVELWALNVTDEEYYQVLFDATLQGSSTAPGASQSTLNGFLGAPRTYGVTARFKF